MSKKHNPKKLSAPELRWAINRALSENRFQHALELARDLFKLDPTPEHRQTLHRAAVGRARQLREQGHVREAGTTLNALAATPGLTDAGRQEIATELAACGLLAEACKLLGTKVENQPVMQARAVDAALAQNQAGRNLLPEELRPDFDRVLQAFQALEQGRDEEARTALLGIGLRSPFLEWKLMLRGLAAWYQNDDSKALENWQRLDPHRLPAHLVAPLRFRIDEAFKKAQKPPVQALLEKQYQALEGPNLARDLRELAKQVCHEAVNMPAVFRKLESLVPQMRQVVPTLVPRLARAMYWAVLNHGNQSDMPRYVRIFGNPPDDPGLHRMNAMGLERVGDMTEAHQAWQRFLAAVEANPGAWPGDQARHIRALVWRRMGDNAANIPEDEQLQTLPDHLRHHPGRPRPLRPGAEECYRQSLKLVPEAIPTWRALLEFQRRTQKLPQAIQTARELLKHDPDHLETLVQLGDMLMESTDYSGALQAYGEALRHNPLDREIRQDLALAQLNLACVQVAQGKLDEARQGFQSALEVKNNPDDPEVLVKWAACEIKAGNNDRAEEMLTRARARLAPLALCYSLLIECIRMKLPAAVKKRFDREFKEGLEEKPTPETVTQLAWITAEHHASGITYVGQKTHQSKVKAYIRLAEKLNFTEAQLETLCESLQRLNEYRLTRLFTGAGRRKFTSPMFSVIEARVELARGSGIFPPIFLLSRLVREAEQRLRTWDAEPRRKEKIQEELTHLRKVIDTLNPFSERFDSPIDFPFFEDDDFEDEP